MKKLEFSIQVIGEKDAKFMNNNIIYKDEPMEVGEVIQDFLPPPEELILKPNKMTVTLELNQESIDFLQVKATEQKTSYQQIISLLIDQYVQNEKVKILEKG